MNHHHFPIIFPLKITRGYPPVITRLIWISASHQGGRQFFGAMRSVPRKHGGKIFWCDETGGFQSCGCYYIVGQTHLGSWKHHLFLTDFKWCAVVTIIQFCNQKVQSPSLIAFHLDSTKMANAGHPKRSKRSNFRWSFEPEHGEQAAKTCYRMLYNIKKTREKGVALVAICTFIPWFGGVCNI